jgi:hypothetical protein
MTKDQYGHLQRCGSIAENQLSDVLLQNSISGGKGWNHRLLSTNYQEIEDYARRRFLDSRFATHLVVLEEDPNSAKGL